MALRPRPLPAAALYVSLPVALRLAPCLSRPMPPRPTYMRLHLPVHLHSRGSAPRTPCRVTIWRHERPCGIHPCSRTRCICCMRMSFLFLIRCGLCIPRIRCPRCLSIESVSLSVRMGWYALRCAAVCYLIARRRQTSVARWAAPIYSSRSQYRAVLGRCAGRSPQPSPSRG